jgi:ParB family chromosome partitioning protein
MLGKGLESLIPKKNNQNNDGKNNVSNNDGDIKPFFLPIGDDLNPNDEIPAPREELDLPKGDINFELEGKTSMQKLPEIKEKIEIKGIQPESLLPSQFQQPKENERNDDFLNKTNSINSNNILQNNIYSGKTDIQKMKKMEEREQESIFNIEVEKIKPNPSQPRKTFEESALRELANSIREFGFIQPLVVTKKEIETQTGIDVSYELIAGERRLNAAKLLGLRLVPAIVRNISFEREKLELAIIENIQRENLNPIETARAFQRLQEEFRMTQREIAAKLGKSREVVANNVRLLDLPQYIQDAIRDGVLSESHGRLLLTIEDPSAQKSLFDDITIKKLTIRDVKDRVKNITHRLTNANNHQLTPELQEAQEHLSSALGAPVEIHKSAENGKITITFYSEEELNNIIRKFISD